MSKLLTVFGATGAQGGSLINFILQHPKLSKDYQLRGITRDVSKPAATDLQARGVELVKADMSDPSSLEKAVAGSYAVFAMTNCTALPLIDALHFVQLRSSMHFPLQTNVSKSGTISPPTSKPSREYP